MGLRLRASGLTSAEPTRNLNRVGLIRIGASAGTAIPPLFDWPVDLVSAIAARDAVVEGGFDYHGREILPVDTTAVKSAAESFKGEVDSVTLVSVFLLLTRRTSAVRRTWFATSSATCPSPARMRSAALVCSSGKTPRF